MDRILEKLKKQRIVLIISGVIIALLFSFWGSKIQKIIGDWPTYFILIPGIMVFLFGVYCRNYDNLRILLIKSIILPAAFFSIHPLCEMFKLMDYFMVINLLTLFLMYYLLNNYREKDYRTKEFEAINK